MFKETSHSAKYLYIIKMHKFARFCSFLDVKMGKSNYL